MRGTILLTSTLLSLALVGCSGVDIQHSAIDQFAAGNYHYYKWRTDPLPQTTRPPNALSAIDPLVRRDIDAQLQRKGYVLDPARAQFTVNYLYATGLVQGQRSALASNISDIPGIMPTRRIDQASVDNAIALGGVKETNNLMVQFNDRLTNADVWQVTVTEIVENVNDREASRIKDNLTQYLQRALQPIPQAPGQ